MIEIYDPEKEFTVECIVNPVLCNFWMILISKTLSKIRK